MINMSLNHLLWLEGNVKIFNENAIIKMALKKYDSFITVEFHLEFIILNCI